MSFRRPKKHHDLDSSLEDASSNAAPSSKRSVLKAAFSARKKHDAPIPTGTVASRISYLQSLGASAQSVSSSAHQPLGVRGGGPLTARRLANQSGEDILEEVDDRGGFGRRTSAKFGFPAKRNESPAFDKPEEKSHTILGWQIKRAKDHADTRSIRSGNSGRSQEKRGLREKVKDVFRTDKEEERPADIPISSGRRRISVKDRAREWSEHQRETGVDSTASFAPSSRRLTIFSQKPVAFTTDGNAAPKKPFVSHFREDLDLPGVAKLEIEGTQVQEVGRLAADSSPSLATLVSPAVEEVKFAKRDFANEPATPENKIETWLADASHESVGSEDSLQHSVTTTSTGRVRSVQQMYTSHGIEQPSELFTQPDIVGKLVAGSRRCHVCRWVNSPVERCTCCGHRLCIDCEKVSYTPDSHQDGAFQLDPSPADEIMFASDDSYSSRITFEPHSWEKPIPKVLRDRKRSSRQSPKSIGPVQKPLPIGFVMTSRESSVVGEIKPLSVSKPGTRMHSLQRRPTPLKKGHTVVLVVLPKPSSPSPSPTPPQRQAEPQNLVTVALPATKARKVVMKVPEPRPALNRPHTPPEVKQIKRRSTVKDSPFLKADRRQSGAGVNGDPSFRRTPLRRAQEMTPKPAPAAAQSAVVEKELHVPGHKVVELNGGDLIEVLPSAPGSLPFRPKSDLPTSRLVGKSATVKTESPLGTHLTAAVAIQEPSPDPEPPSSLLVLPQIAATSESVTSSICRECDSPSCRATHTGYRPYRHSVSCSRKEIEAQVALQVDTGRLTPPSPRSTWKRLQVSSSLVPKPLSPVKRITPSPEIVTPPANVRVVPPTADKNPPNLQEYPFPGSVPGKVQSAQYPVDSDDEVERSPTRLNPPEKYISRNDTPARYRGGRSLAPSHGNVRRSQSRGRSRAEKDQWTLHRDPSRSRSKHGHRGSQWQPLRHSDEVSRVLCLLVSGRLTRIGSPSQRIWTQLLPG